jgi:hypothetical protein
MIPQEMEREKLKEEFREETIKGWIRKQIERNWGSRD